MLESFGDGFSPIESLDVFEVHDYYNLCTMNRTSFILLASIVALVAMALMLREPKQESPTGRSITVFCAASNRAVIEAIRADYEKEFGGSVQVQYGASQTLLSSIEVSRTGDLYLPADDSFLTIAREKHLIAEQIPLAKMHAVVAVLKGNPKQITSLADLLKPGVRLVQANPDAAAIGKLTRATLQRIGQWEALDKATTAYRTTVSDVANDLVVGAADAGIVYDAVLHTYPQLEAIHLIELEAAVSKVAIGVIASSSQPATALHFARYVGANDRGLKHYREHGFQVTTGDTWTDVPEISLFAGSMLRTAIECSIVTQSFAVSKETRFPQLTERLFEQLRSEESRESRLGERHASACRYNAIPLSVPELNRRR